MMQENQTLTNDVPNGKSPQKPDIPHFLKSKKAKVIGLTFLVIFSLLLTSLIALSKVKQKKLPTPLSPTPTPTNDIKNIKYCTQDSDCVLGIKTNICCPCPEPINKNYLDKDGWVEWSYDLSYSPLKSCTEVVCEQCIEIDQAICQNNTCISESNATTTQTKAWKTYTDSTEGFFFNYPSEWFFEPWEGGSVDFFLEGTIPDHSFGDHKGNEVFSINVSSDDRTLESLRKIYYKDASNITIGGKSVLRTDSGIHIVKISNEKNLSIAAGFAEARKYIDQILSTFQFIDPVDIQDGEVDYGFECPDAKILDCLPCTSSPCPMFNPQYCSKGSPQYNWILKNCPNVQIIGLE